MGPVRTWLEAYPWEFVVAQNAVLCAAKNALHKSTSSGALPDTSSPVWPVMRKPSRFASSARRSNDGPAPNPAFLGNFQAVSRMSLPSCKWLAQLVTL